MLVKIRTYYADTPWIKPCKVYEAKFEESGKYHGTYSFIGELGSPVYTTLKSSCHIGNQNWEILEEIKP